MGLTTPWALLQPAPLPPPPALLLLLLLLLLLGWVQAASSVWRHGVVGLRRKWVVVAWQAGRTCMGASAEWVVLLLLLLGCGRDLAAVCCWCCGSRGA